MAVSDSMMCVYIRLAHQELHLSLFTIPKHLYFYRNPTHSGDPTSETPVNRKTHFYIRGISAAGEPT